MFCFLGLTRMKMGNGKGFINSNVDFLRKDNFFQNNQRKQLPYNKFNQSRFMCYQHFENYYALFELPITATIKEIQQSFRQLAKRYHPDVSSDPKHHEKFKSISRAYEILSNQKEKNKYDSIFTNELDKYQRNKFKKEKTQQKEARKEESSYGYGYANYYEEEPKTEKKNQKKQKSQSWVEVDFEEEFFNPFQRKKDKNNVNKEKDEENNVKKKKKKKQEKEEKNFWSKFFDFFEEKEIEFAMEKEKKSQAKKAKNKEKKKKEKPEKNKTKLKAKDHIHENVTINEVEARMGCTKEIETNVLEGCKTCDQNGFLHRPCTCGLPHVYKKGCGKCGGVGFVKEKCGHCEGKGVLFMKKKFTIPIPQFPDEKIKFENRGHYNRDLKKRGDLFIHLQLKEEFDYFKIKGDDVHLDVKLTISQIILGAEIPVPTISGKPLLIKIPSGTQPGDKQCYSGLGIRKGKFYLTFSLFIPGTLSPQEKEILQLL